MASLKCGDTLIAISGFMIDRNNPSACVQIGDVVAVIDIHQSEDHLYGIDVVLLHKLGPITWGSDWDAINKYFKKMNGVS
jgi:hypothetical protein